METKRHAALKKVTLGGGCFWCVEAVYKMLPGVVSVVSGYAGGTTENPTYEEVCSGKTGHAEVVQISYDPVLVSFEKILDLFWSAHDPTTLNRQGADVGTQYRSIILYSNDFERESAVKSKCAARERFEGAIVTEIVPLGIFWPAESYHHDYFSNHSGNPYCAMVIRPKVEKLRLRWAK